MAAPTGKTNLEVIMDCIEALFGTIDHARGYRTNGILVDRDRDPRMLRTDKPEAYRQKHAAVTIALGRRVQDPKVTAGRRRWIQHYTIMGLRTMTTTEDTANRKLDGLVADLQDDLFRAVQKDLRLHGAAAQLHINPPNITGHTITEFENDEGANFPDAHFVGRGQFIYDEWL